MGAAHRRGQVPRGRLCGPRTDLRSGREGGRPSGARRDGGPYGRRVPAPERELAAVQARLGVAEAAAQVEDLLGNLAVHLVDQGVRRLLVAGGETSGAVTTALDIRSVLVGDEADPGVPWTHAPTRSGDLALMLKSGNFGAPDLFVGALHTTTEPK
ncbi:nucleotide-binding domain containing protein [Streptomyces scopuliridis]|uniref:nucleotide-binding domain containing protein n=1 Tax=Streptomyces scopuliridis TaxID=452529 RepID=UPI0036A4DFB1